MEFVRHGHATSRCLAANSFFLPDRNSLCLHIDIVNLGPQHFTSPRTSESRKCKHWIEERVGGIVIDVFEQAVYFVRV